MCKLEPAVSVCISSWKGHQSIKRTIFCSFTLLGHEFVMLYEMVLFQVMGQIVTEEYSDLVSLKTLGSSLEF